MPFTWITQATATDPTTGQFRFDFDIAFQAIFDMHAPKVWGYEALVRGPNGESAADVISGIPALAMHAADQHCRETAIALAANLGLTGFLSINFLRGALTAPEDYIAATLACADGHGFASEKIMLEFSETEQMEDIAASRKAVNLHSARGFLTAMDDFGAGFQGLSLLCDVRPDVVKLDMSMIRNLDRDPRRTTIVASIVRLCEDLGIRIICEGVETEQELACLMDIGVTLFQGFLLARPQIKHLLSPQQEAMAFALVPDRLQTAG